MPNQSKPQKDKISKSKTLMLCFYKVDQTGDQIDNIGLSDHVIKMKKVYRYRDIPRHIEMEEEKLKKTEWCETFKARIAPQVCMLRREYDTAGYCNKCKGPKKSNTPHP
ncbi:MAG: hypothetical protein RDU59_06105 [Thermodesulfobacteriota bacterium]|nr:hypothetical protein [Thermodesulfobacteriota bacterium]